MLDFRGSMGNSIVFDLSEISLQENEVLQAEGSKTQTLIVSHIYVPGFH